MSNWFTQLQPASFRGVPFGVIASDGAFGRRVAVHEYPYRDTPWVEDLGRGTRRIGFTGFLVSDSLVYGGGDVIAQREAMIAACETPGPGTLIHPTLGRLTVSVPDGGLRVAERRDAGRYFELTFAFIESGQRLFPNVSTATGDAVTAAAAAADSAASSDFGTRVAAALKNGSAVVGQAAATASLWARQAQQLSADATNLRNMVGTLSGNFGRFAAGRNVGGLGGISASVLGASSTVQSLINQGAVARANVTTAANALNTAATGLSP